MCNINNNINSLKKNEIGEVCCMGNDVVALKLMEMGCLPGSKIEMRGKAPFGDPLKVMINDEFVLSLRKSEASQVLLK